MNKSIILFAFLVIVVSYTEAQRTCYTACHRGPPTPIRCVKEGKICRKIRQCSLNGENCVRKSKGLSPLNPINMSSCQNILTQLGSGDCASGNCSNKSCAIHTKELMCYRSRRGNCRLLTPCQRNRLNCERNVNNQLTWINPRACSGIKAGDKQKCKTVLRKG